MSMQSWCETIFSQGSGPALTAASEALLVTDVSIPAGYMYPGRTLHLQLTGKASNAITTPGTLTLRIRWGGLTGTVLAASAALAQIAASTQTDKTWVMDAYVRCLTDGATGTFLTWGLIHRGNAENATAANATPDMLPDASNAAVTVDTTTAKLLSVTAQPSLTTASITCLGYVLKALN